MNTSCCGQFLATKAEMESDGALSVSMASSEARGLAKFSTGEEGEGEKHSKILVSQRQEHA